MTNFFAPLFCCCFLVRVPAWVKIRSGINILDPQHCLFILLLGTGLLSKRPRGNFPMCEMSSVCLTSRSSPALFWRPCGQKCGYKILQCTFYWLPQSFCDGVTPVPIWYLRERDSKKQDQTYVHYLKENHRHVRTGRAILLQFYYFQRWLVL